MKAGISLQMLALLLGLAFAVTASHATPPERELSQAEMDAVLFWYQRVKVEENLKAQTRLFRINPERLEDQPRGGVSSWALMFDAHRRVLKFILIYTAKSLPAEKFTEAYGRNGELLKFEALKANGKMSGVVLTFKDEQIDSMFSNLKFQIYSETGAEPLYRIPKEAMLAVNLRVKHEYEKVLEEINARNQ